MSYPATSLSQTNAIGNCVRALAFFDADKAWGYVDV